MYLGGNIFYTNLFLRYFRNIKYLEDGVGACQCYERKDRQVIQKRSSFLANFIWGPLYPWLGLAEQVNSVYMTAIFPVPELIREKVRIIDLKDLWKRKSLAEQREIMHIFLPDDFDPEIFSQYETLLITQPYSEISRGKRISEVEKVKIYRKLISPYDETKVVIKPHPREKTDYKHFFPKAYVFDLPCPLELLVLLNCHICRAISVYSTASFNLGDDVENIITGYSVSPLLEEEARYWGWKIIE